MTGNCVIDEMHKAAMANAQRVCELDALLREAVNVMSQQFEKWKGGDERETMRIAELLERIEALLIANRTNQTGNNVDGNEK